LIISGAMPIGIWWREATGSRQAKIFEVAVSIAAAFVGFVLYFLFVARIGFLLTGPYSGQMATEATIYLLAMYSIAASASAFLMLAPLFLGSPFFAQSFRKRVWRTVVVALPIATTAALLIGPRLRSVFW
jgi:hypothetical protein